MKHKILWTVLSVVAVLGLLAGVFGCAQPAAPSETTVTTTATKTTTATATKTETERGAVIRFSHSAPAGQPYTTNWFADKFKEIVEEKTNGRITVEIFPGGQLYKKVTDEIEALGVNAIQAEAGSASYWMKFDPHFGIGTVGRFQKWEDVKAFMDDIGQKTLEPLLISKGIHYMTYYGAEPLIFVFTDPVNSLEDLKGRLVRAAGNPFYLASFDVFGMKVVSLSSSEAYTALQQGVAEGAFSYMSVCRKWNWTEICKYAVRGMQQGHGVYYFGLSEEFWSGLSSADQEILQGAATEAAAYSDELNEEMKVTTWEKFVEEDGGTIWEPTAAELAPYKDAMIEASYKGLEECTDFLDLAFPYSGFK